METEAGGREGLGDYAGSGGGRRRGAAAPGGAPTGLAYDGMRRVALEEMALRRPRLGELTPAQERALELLLVSIADNISVLVSGVTAWAPRRARGGEACAPPTADLEAVSAARAEGAG